MLFGRRSRADDAVAADADDDLGAAFAEDALFTICAVEALKLICAVEALKLICASLIVAMFDVCLFFCVRLAGRREWLAGVFWCSCKCRMLC
jgi:hypothetical protein